MSRKRGHRISDQDVRHLISSGHVPIPQERNISRGRRRMLQTNTGMLIGLVLGLGIAAVVWLLFGGMLPISPLERGAGLPIGSAKDFSDGIGIYVLNDGKYNF